MIATQELGPNSLPASEGMQGRFFRRGDGGAHWQVPSCVNNLVFNFNQVYKKNT